MSEIAVVKIGKPKKKTSRKELEATAASNRWGKYENYPDGTAGVILGDLGFMYVLYHVALYEPAPTRFRPDRMKLSRHSMVDDDPRLAHSMLAAMEAAHSSVAKAENVA